MTERGYTIKRTFDAPPDVVFEAWTDRLVMDLSEQAGEEYEHARVGTDSFMDSLARCLPGMLKARHDAY